MSDPGPVPREPPDWERVASRALREVAARVRLIGCATPTNWTTELAALCADFAAGREREPAFAYAPETRLEPERRLLAALVARLESGGALAALYAARATELALEAELCEEVGRPSFFVLARHRYAPRDAFDAAGDALAEEWLAAPDFSDVKSGAFEPPAAADPDAGELVQSDDETRPDSLVCRLRAEIGTARLPVRVVPATGLAALAATGAGVVFVERGRWLSRRAIERTVVHELYGHVAPRERALAAPLGIFASGTARGSDDQEGRALAFEERAGWLDGARRTELALRHRAARITEHGASFVDTVAALAASGAPLALRLRIAARAHRGGGLAREAVYLPAYLRVAALGRAHPRAAEVLACGRVACEAAELLGRWL